LGESSVLAFSPRQIGGFKNRPDTERDKRLGDLEAGPQSLLPFLLQQIAWIFASRHVHHAQLQPATSSNLTSPKHCLLACLIRIEREEQNIGGAFKLGSLILSQRRTH
jgi:hypothetical protein